jgi:hypothetical protein
MVLSNINAGRRQSGLEVFSDVELLVEEIGIGKTHDSYEDLISRAELLMQKYGKNSESATMVIHGE